MSRYHDARAEAILHQLDTIWKEFRSNPITVKATHQGIHGTLPWDEAKMLSDRWEELADNFQHKRDVILESQLKQDISGIEWIASSYGNISIELPRIHEQLKAIATDKQILTQSKSSALNFLTHWHQAFKVWQYLERDWKQVQWNDFCIECSNREWLEIWVDDFIYNVTELDGTITEYPVFAINACCYWGDPIEANKTEFFPRSGLTSFQFNNSIPIL
ncbi:MAG: hypothetical protein PUP90_08790 [Nostoc sp. S4]|nr:hypothetical protein [Nostoc sp. S4]